MSINDKIEAAFNESLTPEKHDLLKKAIEKLPPDRATKEFAKIEFAEGYRAMAKSLYVEVRPEDRLYKEVYDCQTRDGRWMRLMHFTPRQNYWDCNKENPVPYNDVVRTVRMTVIPSPSEVFGEEGV